MVECRSEKAEVGVSKAPLGTIDTSYERGYIPAMASDIIGQKRGRLTVINTWQDAERPYTRWLACNCDCGKTNHICRYNNFHTGRSQSCGCLVRENANRMGEKRRIHGDSMHPTYKYWITIRKRGGLAGGWEDYRAFKAFVGERLTGRFIIRKDDKQPFSPENFDRWGGRNESMRQRRNGRLITVRGETKSMAEWADITGVSRQAFQQWLADPKQTRTPAQIEDYIFDHEKYRRETFDRASAKRRNTFYRKRAA